ncbi:LmeA family phospholipid-binding protein [Baaleninema sp.]|uniref:LmeA family phospholipid-binding protein n=1 Tax=Baaleninema sp. TaxID=3101197 RepID=UPI003CFF6C59
MSTSAVDLQKPSKSSVGNAIAAALRLWLRSQVETVDRLEIDLNGRNRDILSGYVPQVSISARRAVYQGLHLSHIDLCGDRIRVNLWQILKGKPLRLLEPVPVSVRLHLRDRDLTRSLASPLLQTPVQELFQSVLPDAVDFSTAEVRFDRSSLILSASTPQPFTLTTEIRVAENNQLQFLTPQLETDSLQDFPTITVPFDSQVQLDELALDRGKLSISGRLTVRSDEP